MFTRTYTGTNKQALKKKKKKMFLSRVESLLASNHYNLRRTTDKWQRNYKHELFERKGNY
jgi:hypothetical protein